MPRSSGNGTRSWKTSSARLRLPTIEFTGEGISPIGSQPRGHAGLTAHLHVRERIVRLCRWADARRQILPTLPGRFGVKWACHRLMPLASGARLGPYEILAPLGADGMVEVYRAHNP